MATKNVAVSAQSAKSGAQGNSPNAVLALGIATHLLKARLDRLERTLCACNVCQDGAR
jgi:hypothetical protein